MRKSLLLALLLSVAGCASRADSTYIDPLNLVSSLDRKGLNEIIGA